ncbi:TonB-dependent receptor [Neptunitalea chrysea]|uniref:TonB-dependent receptor n=1 Tax=Neptunitalea chrysea TaxID=1647581 RepID=A0A9W6ETB9_9FLAO|nr:TonB-dependent receptor [Neptunitalea chrysea]GLB51665.1 TonB-dependent receptor [Neptunitalea chrysea]
MNMKQSYLISLFVFFAVHVVHAQEPIPLEEVEVSDSQLKRFSNTQQTTVLTDSVLAKNEPSLTSLLNYSTNIYFKENGLGMVSSPSFRGTTSQQTAVLWNGININSQLNGQTDFNTISIRTFDEVEVRSGGGSVLFGSGAIGGSIHLNDYLRFNKGFNTSALLRYGSFNTLDSSVKSGISGEKWSANLAIGRTSSDNDYDYVAVDAKNTNGQFYNNSFSFNTGYKINDKNLLKWYSYLYDGERHFSTITTNETKTKYRDFNTRNLVEWDGFYGKWLSKTKLAYITEHYKYYANIDSDNYTEGEAKTFIGKYDIAYNVSPKLLLNAVADVTHTNGEGSSIPESERTITSFNIMAKHTILEKLLYEATLRKEITANYDSPFLYSLGINYQLTKQYEIRFNTSKNFRIPTYNDLYWVGSGNPNLLPETSVQYEVGNSYSSKHINASVTAFYNNIEDMIQWLPSGSVWTPVNTQHVNTYGAETQLKTSLNIKSHEVVFIGNYAYTVSKNQETDKQLVYVPYHKGGGALSYGFKNISVQYQLLYVGEVFILADNSPNYVLDDYLISNLSSEYVLGEKQKLTIGVKVNNIWNKAYQTVANRYMPGLNFNFYLHFKL